jgi:hypothetical protein
MAVSHIINICLKKLCTMNDDDLQYMRRIIRDTGNKCSVYDRVSHIEASNSGLLVHKVCPLSGVSKRSQQTNERHNR